MKDFLKYWRGVFTVLLILVIPVYLGSLIVFPALDEIRESGREERRIRSMSHQLCLKCGKLIGIYIDPRTGHGSIFQGCGCKKQLKKPNAG